ncbi:SDR family NAD(P)-dependent oxidoreductase [Paenibacillus methanolicus]|uniref:Short-subunit dehydrogenase n=1 Tax=Paenibacillus methanolicus TaxID=582686 RepID=A0A5S5C677_9BACL|nr:SDR family NAD(P)-dependent oxidoreductase [Paenibacillus methanolicus]TYP73886.1 short-subunit dehydrogenase [Paenibacillus methanolicus]
MKIAITGASRGLGYELARAAAKKGHTVYAGMRDPGDFARYGKLDPQVGERIIPIELDVASRESIRSFADTLAAREASIDGLVNNAAILLGREDGIESLDPDALTASLTTNLVGPVLVAQALLPLLRGAKLPSILNISSEAGAYASVYAGDYPYGLSKAALTYFNEKLRMELAPQGFQVLAIHPGWIRTDMGGEQAPGDPAATAEAIISLLERARPLQVGRGFVDARGQELPI